MNTLDMACHVSNKIFETVIGLNGMVYFFGGGKPPCVATLSGNIFERNKSLTWFHANILPQWIVISSGHITDRYIINLTSIN